MVLNKVLDNCIWFLHVIGLLLDFLWCCHLHQQRQKVMSSCVPSCHRGTGEPWSCGALRQSGDAVKPSREYSVS